MDRLGALYIADSQTQRVRKILAGGVISTVVGGSPSTALLTPLAIAVDVAGTLYVADSSNIVRSYSVAGAWTNVAGTGQPGFSGDSARRPPHNLRSPRDLAVDLARALYIADGVRIRKVAGGQIQTVAGDGYLHAIGDGGPATDSLLSQPFAITLNSAGSLYIADTGTQRVRQVLPSGAIQTLVGTGAAGFGADNVAATTAMLN